MSGRRLSILVLLLVVAVTQAALFAERADELFQTFKQTYGRKYKTPEEEVKRKEIFRQSMVRVDTNNQLNGSPVFGVTKFSDWTREEFKVLLGRKSMGRTPKYANDVRDPFTPEKWGAKNARDITKLGTPTYVNWAAEGYTTPVKNQGQCGSCWAFSAAETIESEWKFQGNYLWEFSPQQIASCTTTCDGCGGGETYLAYEYIESVVGLGSSWFAPYTQSMYEICETSKCTTSCSTFSMSDLETYGIYTGPYATLSGYSYATPKCSGTCTNQNTTLLAQNVATYGPASVCVNAANWGDYTTGVLTPTGCGGSASTDLDHCVQLVGYNSGATSPYWLVRNSWATNWGEKGYILLQYPDNTCGLADEATFVAISNSQANFTF